MTEIQTALTGFDLINEPMLNKGTAFTESERDDFALHGLLPPHIGTLEDQIARRLMVFHALPNGFSRYSFLRDLQDINETLFYAVLSRRIDEMMPVVYTPTVGEGCQRFSEIWRKPRGLFLSYPNRHRMDAILSNPRYDDVRCIVVSDGERILGLGDQGAGGMGIPIGKLALYTALAGIHPRQCLPVLLDVGTDNEDRLRDPIYIGWKQKRVRGSAYDEFIDTFVQCVKARWPQVLLQWEDFAGANASRLLARYRDQLCTFNDDIQGTAAIALATLQATTAVTGIPLTEQRIAIVGFGSAGLGIASILVEAVKRAGLSPEAAYAVFYAIDKDGLLVEGMSGIRPEQAPFARKGYAGGTTLEEVIASVRPTTLIGVSGQPGAFPERAVREMARHVDRPVILPLSNPTSRSEATPADLITWTGGRALIGTGSPFPGVDQTNNSYIFPGLALGIISVKSRRVTDGMFVAAAQALAEMSPARKDRTARLLPPINEIRNVSVVVARAVARQAIADDVAEPMDADQIETAIRKNIWNPVYLPYRRKLI